MATGPIMYTCVQATVVEQERACAKWLRAPSCRWHAVRAASGNRGWPTHSLAAGVIVVAVDGKYRELDVEVWVLEINGAVISVEGCRLVGNDLQVHVAIAEAVVAQHLDGTLHGLTRWLVLMEQVAREQHQVGTPLVGDLEYLFERVARVMLADGITLVDAEVAVGGYQDVEHLTLGDEKSTNGGG